MKNDDEGREGVMGTEEPAIKNVNAHGYRVFAPPDDPAGRLEDYLEEASGLLGHRVRDDSAVTVYTVREGILFAGDIRVAAAAIRDRDAEIARLVRERNAMMIGVICNALDGDDELVERMLGDPENLSEANRQFIKATEESSFAKYLDLPSDLEVRP